MSRLRPARFQGPRQHRSQCRQRKLKVSFFGPFFFGNYWVLDHPDGYEWSIVGEPSGRFLWILCRDPTPPEKIYQGLVERARSLGYDMTRFRRTRQLPA